MKSFLCFLLGGLSWLCSYLVDTAYSVMTWQCLVSLMLVDFVFIFAFYASGTNYIKLKWVLTLLFVAMSISSLSAFTMAVAQAGFIYSDFFLLRAFESYYSPFSFVVSLLVLIVLGTPQRIIGAFDANCWPKSFSGVPYDLFMDSLQHRKGGS